MSKTAVLDRAWEMINALGTYRDSDEAYWYGWGDAIKGALEQIDELGGMDPVERQKEQERADERDCSCRWPSVNSASIEPPDGPVLNRQCPVHGEDPDAARDRQIDDERDF